MIFRKNEIKMRWNKFVTILAHDKLYKLILILKLFTKYTKHFQKYK